MRLLKATKIIFLISILFITLLILIPTVLQQYTDAKDPLGVITFVNLSTVLVENNLHYDDTTNLKSFIFKVIVLVAFCIIISLVVMLGLKYYRKKGFFIFEFTFTWVIWILFSLLTVWSLFEIMWRGSSNPFATNLSKNITVQIFVNFLFLLGPVLWLISNILQSFFISHINLYQMSNINHVLPTANSFDKKNEFQNISFNSPLQSKEEFLNSKHENYSNKITDLSFNKSNGVKDFGNSVENFESKSNYNSAPVDVDNLFFEKNLNVRNSDESLFEINPADELNDKSHHNPNAKVYDKYKNKVFLGDSEKIWNITSSNRKSLNQKIDINDQKSEQDVDLINDIKKWTNGG